MIPEGVDIKTATCDVCGKRRKCGRFARFYWRCAECYLLPVDEVRALISERRLDRRRNPKPRFAYPCIGGPLDGEYATTVDFYTEFGDPSQSFYRSGGMYGHLAREYHEYNCGHHTRPRIGSTPPSMVFLHASVLKPLAAPRER